MTVLTELWTLVKVSLLVFRLYLRAKREGWYLEGRELAKKLTDAKSDEERADLIKSIHSHVNSK